MKQTILSFIILLLLTCFSDCIFLQNMEAEDNSLRNPCPLLDRIKDNKRVRAASFNGYTYIELSSRETIYIETKFVESVDSIDNDKSFSEYLGYYKLICKIEKPPFYNDISIVKNKL
ncbi:MAG: hypothetical protein IPQ05_06520 [Leptospiraceae bacterium]|nr:hypothetical protein [Leptospiraceae bacterium]